MEDRRRPEVGEGGPGDDGNDVEIPGPSPPWAPLLPINVRRRDPKWVRVEKREVFSVCLSSLTDVVERFCC
jgi:hypothetical protein